MSCLLYAPGAAPAALSVPDRTLEDLQLERLAAAMCWSAYYRVTAKELCALWTDDPVTLLHRQAVIRDLLTIPGLANALGRLLDSLDGWEGRSGGRRAGSLDAFAVGFSTEDFGWLQGYLQKIDAACSELSAFPAESEGLRSLTALLQGLRGSDRYRDMAEGFRTLCAGYAAPARMRIGYALDRELKPSRLKLLRMEGPGKDKGKAASRRPMMLTQRASETSAMLLQRLTAQAGQDIGSFVLRETAALRGLRRELIFCLCAYRLAESWRKAGLPCCFPRILPREEKAFAAKDLFDPLLLLSRKDAVVPNDAELRRGGELVFLTGANQGGKTVFLLSVGLCQWLAQLGFPVPAREAALSPARNILTIFAPNGQQYGRKGLLAEEAGRMAEAVDALTGDSLLLFNEPLTSTGPEETRSISAEVAAVCLAAGARGVWVTHVYELARERERLTEAVPWGSRTGSMRVVLEEENGSPRSTYRVERGEPLGDSHAQEALRRGGVLLS